VGKIGREGKAGNPWAGGSIPVAISCFGGGLWAWHGINYAQVSAGKAANTCSIMTFVPSRRHALALKKRKKGGHQAFDLI